MEFLDSKSKRNRTIRLFLGYFLIIILIGLATFILVYLAQGYGYDTDKGVIRSGLVFVNAKPEGVAADIYIDGELRTKTDARLVIDEGAHKLNIKKSNYREWSKAFTLEGGSVLYFAYPMLIPNNITLGITKVFDGTPVWASQSPDKRWVVLQTSSNSPLLTVIDLEKPQELPHMSTLSSTQILNQNGTFGAIMPIEWADDNRHLLLSQTMSDGTKSYTLFDRENSDLSINLTKKLGLTNPTELNLRDKKFDKYYIFDSLQKLIKYADLKNGPEITPLLSNVLAYKSYSDDLIMYISDITTDGNKVVVNVLSNQTDIYRLQDIVKSPENHYLLDIAQYNKNWYYITSSTGDDKVLIYRNPLGRSRPEATEAIKPQMNLQIANPQSVSFSMNTRFICIQSGKKFIVYDGEQNRFYKYESPLAITLDQHAKWMDGHRMMLIINNMINIFEFDGQNIQTLTPGLSKLGAFFDKDYRYIYSFRQLPDGKIGFESGQLVL